MKLFLIAGHGEGDPGAEGGGYTEAERVRALAERMKYYGGDNVIIGDTKVCEFTDEMIFDLFEKIQVPIEIQDIDINNFKNKIIDAIKKAISS